MKDNKKKIQSEYYRGVRKVMEIKLNSVNLLKALNNWAAAVLSYSVSGLGKIRNTRNGEKDEELDDNAQMITS